MKTIDTDLVPTLPDWVDKVVENKTYGKIEWKPELFELYLSEKQKNDYIKGEDLREEMKDKNPVNFAILSFLKNNPKLIPKEWRRKYIYGWGTVVLSRNGNLNLNVPYLLEDDGEVVLFWRWLVSNWFSGSPALRFASPLPFDTKTPLTLGEKETLKEAVKIINKMI